MDKYLKRLCKAILADRFNDENYRQRNYWYGHEIETMPLFCSYGTIGFTAQVFDERGNNYCSLSYDREMRELLIDEKPYKHYINLLYLENNDISLSSESVWDNLPHSVELGTYTDAGEDMIIDLEEPTKEKLQEYINGFDINEEV